MNRTLLATVLLGCSLVGCDKKKDAKKDAPAPASSAQAASSSPAAATKPASAGVGATAGGSGATAHLAGDCEAVVHVDIAALLAAPAVKSQVVPALDEVFKKEPKNDDDKRMKAALADAGIDPLHDISEAVVCVSDAKNAFDNDKNTDPTVSVILGGNLKAGKLNAALLKNAKPGKKMSEVDVGGVKAVTDDKGEGYVGQASDGAIIMAFGKRAKDRFAEAVKGGGAAKYQIPSEAVSVIVTGETVKGAMSSGGPGNPFAAQATKVADAGAAVSVDLTKSILRVRLAMADEKAATELAGVVKMLLGQMQKAPAMPGPGAAAAAMMKDAKIETTGKDLVIEVALPQDQIDAGAKQLAAKIRKGK